MLAFTDKFTFLGILGFRALGDFVSAVTVCAYMKRKKRNSVLLVYAQDDRPYKRQVLELCPDIDDKALVTGPGIPMDWLDISGENPNAAPKVFVDKGFAHADFVLGPKMIMDINYGAASESFRCLRFPEEMAEELEGKLIAAGVSPDRWIVTTHVRQEGYKYRQIDGLNPVRAVDPENYFRLADHIIDELGGQVVCLGSPNMMPPPARSHLIDLSREEDNFLLQAYALSRSRFLVATDSGMLTVGNALGVPFAAMDLAILAHVIDGQGFTFFHDQHALLTRLICYDDNVPQDAGELGKATRFGHIVMFENTFEELRAVADHMMEMTRDCEGWRDRYVEGTIEAFDSLTYPMVSPPPAYNWFKPPWWERDPELAEHLRKSPPLATRHENGVLVIEPITEPGD